MQVFTGIVVLLSLEGFTLGFDMPGNHYVGFFQDGDIIVGRDNIYKEAHPFNRVKAPYGRVFPCIISYYAVVDKTKYDVLPDVKTVRGGLGQHFVNLVITSPISKPLAVNVYVACHNLKKNESAVDFTKSTDKDEESVTEYEDESITTEANETGDDENETGDEENETKADSEIDETTIVANEGENDKGEDDEGDDVKAETITTEPSTTEASTTEASTTEASTTEASTTAASTTEASTEKSTETPTGDDLE